MISETVTSMKKLKFLVSLTTNDNDYQIEQAASAEEAARRLGVEIQIIYAEEHAEYGVPLALPVLALNQQR